MHHFSDVGVMPYKITTMKDRKWRAHRKGKEDEEENIAASSTS
jgi:hypothetical protein